LIIINADDWGHSEAETEAALACWRGRRITSVSAMVFMADSERAASLAREAGVDVGLHLNLSQGFTGQPPAGRLSDSHRRVVRFMKLSRYAVLVYHPMLRREFRRTYQAQMEEFLRLYGRRPSHIDGHQHRHLCANVIFDTIIPPGEKVRRNFSFWPGEKSGVNRSYRRFVDKRLAGRYQLTDFFFSLGQCLQNDRLARVVELAGAANVELMTHPKNREEYKFLTSELWRETLKGLQAGSYSSL
jgi:predicted glycoside hydrolase/deacetylase ChbG (UPF0249 family)